jgi:cob(I)alamin adenosyltransferase
MIQLFTGYGKGKTTAALGQAIRAAGAGKKVAIVYFDKGGEHYSERKALRENFPQIEVFATGRDRIDLTTGAFDFRVTDEDKEQGDRGLDIVRRLFKEGKHDLIVLDEICSSANLSIVDEAAVLELLDARPPSIELILTGRDAPKSFVDRADLVTEMKLVKHYFYQGVKAREGFDY